LINREDTKDTKKKRKIDREGIQAEFGMSFPDFAEVVGELDFLAIDSCSPKFHSQTVAGMGSR
jgi:hypothetical protein